MPRAGDWLGCRMQLLGSQRTQPASGCWTGGTNPRLGPGRPCQLDQTCSCRLPFGVRAIDKRAPARHRIVGAPVARHANHRPRLDQHVVGIVVDRRRCAVRAEILCPRRRDRVVQRRRVNATSRQSFKFQCNGRGATFQPALNLAHLPPPGHADPVRKRCLRQVQFRTEGFNAEHHAQ